MILLPLPAVVAVLLGFLLCLLVLQGQRRLRPIMMFLAVSVALMTIVSLRWSIDAAVFRFLQPVVAALLPPTAWLCFSGFQAGTRRSLWPHLVPTGLILVLSLVWQQFPTPIDALLAILFFGYGAALIWRGAQGEGGFSAARLGERLRADHAAMFVGALLVLSGVIDLAIALDFGWGGGTHAGKIVSLGNMVMLPLIAWAGLAVARSLPEAEEPVEADIVREPAVRDDAADAHIVAETHRILRERRLYRDPDLTLDRLARRVGIPARQISGAINRELGRNVSQEINAWRIAEAIELLERTDRHVTSVMFDCGFQTKSNFNYTFRRATGLSPSDWRRRAKEDAKPASAV